ncbi:hypothetical protein A1p_00060 [Klebsiella phage VLCpiA1p]|nr:hypothetical protein A1p_00060 [Klebsiella phage VLCpiA1p]
MRAVPLVPNVQEAVVIGPSIKLNPIICVGINGTVREPGVNYVTNTPIVTGKSTPNYLYSCRVPRGTGAADTVKPAVNPTRVESAILSLV